MIFILLLCLVSIFQITPSSSGDGYRTPPRIAETRPSTPVNTTAHHSRNASLESNLLTATQQTQFHHYSTPPTIPSTTLTVNNNNQRTRLDNNTSTQESGTDTDSNSSNALYYSRANNDTHSNRQCMIGCGCCTLLLLVSIGLISSLQIGTL